MKQYIFDVRQPYEYEAGHVDGAINIPHDDIDSFKPVLDDIPKDSQIILYCRSGQRASVAKRSLHELGYDNVLNAETADQVKNLQV